jgi:hypothetical protein
MAILFNQGDGLLKEGWVGHDWKPKLWSRSHHIFFIKNIIKKTNKILADRLEGMFWVGNKVWCSFFLWTLGLAFEGFASWPSKSRGCESHGQRFGLWAWPLEASHYAQPKAPIPIFDWLFSTHFFGLSTKFGHSIQQPLDLDGHNVKWPLLSLT